ncbi:MAG: hypothetical protein GX661_01100, partial [Acholeplasmataceae bacterium]|nr:hypothetical protein [Acholeplasmataceae bacterium]
KAALTIFSCGFYLFLAGIISSNRKDGRTIHDFLFRTRVIVLTRYADEKIENFVSEDMKDTLRGSRYDD